MSVHDVADACFDGLVGPTHNYAGLSTGNVASLANRGRTASPRGAALEGLAKMWRLAELGVVQGVLPPQERPDVTTLRRFGFTGSDADVVADAARREPRLLAACSSASAMWTANAATVAPSADTDDGRVHFTPANLQAKPHRALEADGTAAALRRIFPDPARFAHHEPLAGGQAFGDEGAANHMRLVGSGAPAVHVFVYGREATRTGGPAPRTHVARQTLEASRAVARLHRLNPSRTLFVQQSPDAIDAGVFHNDVVAVARGRVLFCHERAFLDRDVLLSALDRLVPGLQVELVREADVPMQDAVSSYLFNSQLVACPGRRGLTLVAPRECEETPSVRALLERVVGPDRPIEDLVFVDLRQSMCNGGGPACLRLRVELAVRERAAVNPACLLTATRYSRLTAWVRRHYRDRLAPADLADPALLRESREALDELTTILGLGSLYPFQQAGGPNERTRLAG